MRRTIGVLLPAAVLALSACVETTVLSGTRLAEHSPAPSPTATASSVEVAATATPQASPSLVPSASPKASASPSPAATQAVASEAATPAALPTTPPPPTPIPTLAPNGYTVELVAGNGSETGHGPNPNGCTSGDLFDGPGPVAGFRTPISIAFDRDSNILVSDFYDHDIRRINVADGSVETVVGNSTECGASHENGVGGKYPLWRPCQLAVGPDGTLYVTEEHNNDVRSAKALYPDGPGPAKPTYDVEDLCGWGNGKQSDDDYGGSVTLDRGIDPRRYVDGPASDARFYHPFGCAVGPAGTLYVSDRNNNCIRRVNLTDGSVTTFAGDPHHVQADGTVQNFKDGPDKQALFQDPYGLACDKAGNLFVADRANNRIREVAPDGTVTTVAGGDQGGYWDGNGTDARFFFPEAVALDAKGNLIVADTGNNCIRMIDMSTPAHAVSTIAGNGVPGYLEGEAVHARFNRPEGVGVAPNGDIIVADSGNRRVRRIKK